MGRGGWAGRVESLFAEMLLKLLMLGFCMKWNAVEAGWVWLLVVRDVF